VGVWEVDVRHWLGLVWPDVLETATWAFGMCAAKGNSTLPVASSLALIKEVA
jgi:hypothetical protein